MSVEGTQRKKTNPVYENLAIVSIKDPGLLCLVGNANAAPGL